MIFVGIFIIALQWMRYKSRLFYIEMDQDDLDANDYTIMIHNLPEKNYNELELR
jgi:hypothetical protein